MQYKHTYSEVIGVTSYVEDRVSGIEVQQVKKRISLFRVYDFGVGRVRSK